MVVVFLFGLRFVVVWLVLLCFLEFVFVLLFPAKKLCEALTHFYNTHLSFITLLHLSVLKTFSEEKALLE